MNKHFCDLEKSKELLIEAIGDRSMAEFAVEAGITPITMTGIMNREVLPSKNILYKIAGHSVGISLNELLHSYGYELKDKDERGLDKLSVKERVKKNMNSVMLGFTKLKGKEYDSVYDYCDSVYMLYAEEELCILEKDVTKLEVGEWGDAETVEIVQFSWKNEKFSAVMDICIFYRKTENDKIFVEDVAFDNRTVGSYGSSVVARLVSIGKAVDDGRAILIKLPIIDKPMTAEEKLLRAIGERLGREKPHNKAELSGIGFALDRNMEYVFKKFLKKHKDTFCVSEEEKSIYRDYIDGYEEGTDINSYFCLYKMDNKTNCVTSEWGNAIANIIYRETGLNVVLCDNEVLIDNENYEQEHLTKEPHLMFIYRAPWEYNEIEKEVTRQFIINTLDKYARELRSETKQVKFKTYI